MNATEVAGIFARLNRSPTVANIAEAARNIDSIRKAISGVDCRLGCVASFTFDPIRSALELHGLQAGLNLHCYIAPYGQFEQELLNPSSGLAAFKPDATILAIRLQDVCPAIYDAFNGLDPGVAHSLVQNWHQRLEACLSAFRRHSNAHVFIQNYDLPACPATGIADGATSSDTQTAVMVVANKALYEVAAAFENVRIMDFDALVARHGRLNWSDPRMALYARIPVAPANWWALAGFYVRHLRPVYGLSRKVLCLDADNTLWGGVVGDLGTDNIALGHDYPGNAYVAFQKRILDLYHRGVILCLASKNEPGAVEDVLEKHPDMVLRNEHFAAMRVNWNDKPGNLRSMAEQLNLGIDSFVFLDDSPVEVELMRSTLPQVMSIALPPEPAHLAGVVDSLDCFDQWTISDEDRQRGQIYRAEGQRRELQGSALDLPGFYRQLDMKLTLFLNHAPHVSRAAQMTARTNQFNMKTIRCSDDDIRRFMSQESHAVITLALQDRFGDNGVIGLAVIEKKAASWNLHMLMMSCRILGRTVEQSFIRWIAAQARAAGASTLTAEFLPTAKNKPFADFYRSCGFLPDGERQGAQCWSLSLSDADTTLPDWIEVTVHSAPEHTR